MRRQNSTFKTGFISEAGSELKNHDYFAFVELEDYACYVIQPIRDRSEEHTSELQSHLT